jgi:hypothetical protein
MLHFNSFKASISCFLITVLLVIFSHHYVSAGNKENCDLCHKHPKLARYLTNGEEISFYAPSDKFSKQRHKTVKCEHCHRGANNIPHINHRAAKPDAHVKSDCTGRCHDMQDPGTMKHYDSIPEDNENAPQICIKCHGDLPHTKALYARSLYNMHTGFMACEVCHIREEKGLGNIEYVWIDYETDRRIFENEALPETNRAKIVPILTRPDGLKSWLDKSENVRFTKDYMNNGHKWTLQEKAKAKGAIHKGYTYKPLLCNECHSEKSYLPLKKLLYSEQRIKELTGKSMQKVSHDYVKYFLPTMLKPIGAK